MEPDSKGQSARPHALPRSPTALARVRRPLAITTAVVFGISLVFPITAALSSDTSAFPAWWGPLDVIVAGVLAITAIALFAIVDRNVTSQAREATYRAYRVSLHGILALVVVFFVAGDRITWRFGLLGMAWRTWLLLYGLPAWYTAWERPNARAGPAGD